MKALEYESVGEQPQLAMHLNKFDDYSILYCRISSDPQFGVLHDNNIMFSVTWRDTECREDVGLQQLVDMWYITQEHVDVFIGMFKEGIIFYEEGGRLLVTSYRQFSLVPL